MVGRVLTWVSLPFRSTANKVNLIRKGRISPNRLVKYAVKCPPPLRTAAKEYIQQHPQVLKSALIKLVRMAVDEYEEAEAYLLDHPQLHSQVVDMLGKYLESVKRDSYVRSRQLVWHFYQREKAQKILEKIKNISKDTRIKTVIDGMLAGAPPVELKLSRMADWRGPNG